VDILVPKILALLMSPQTKNYDLIKTTPNIILSAAL
jgi:hypothetical protein